MKKQPPEAISLNIGRLTQSDFEQINKNSIVCANEIHSHLEKMRASVAGRDTGAHGADDLTPATNRGVKSEIAARLVLEDGQIMEIPARRTWGGDAAILDWVNFTTDESDFIKGISAFSDEDIIRQVSYCCDQIFGFGITSKRETGANFYHRSYVLGDAYGMVCHGGQRNTVLVMLSGQGCAAARFGWEKRLYDFLRNCSARCRLTRVDLAYDDYQSDFYSVDRADSDYEAGLFNCGGRNPNHEYRGNWKRPNGKGRTVYIGNRENGKYARIYEKGKQLGDKNSLWVRVELELKSVNRILPFEILLNPGQYLAAAYPAFGWISAKQERIPTTQKTLEISYKAAVAFAKKQLGTLINAMVHLEESKEAVIDKLIRDGMPKRLKVPDYRFVGDCLHDYPKKTLSGYEIDASLYPV